MLLEKKNIKIEEACKILFGNAFNCTLDTLKYIRPEGVKRAFREKAKNYHPDMAVLLGKSEKELNITFKKIHSAYVFLMNAIDKRKNNSDRNINANAKNKADNNTDFFYTGKMPEKKLKFAEFLFYSRVISWRTLIKAIVWQYKNRPRVGLLCKQCNLLNDREIINIIKITKFKKKFGETAVGAGFITKDQLKRILKIQLNFNLPIGKYFVENNFFLMKDLYKYLSLQNIHNKVYYK